MQQVVLYGQILNSVVGFLYERNQRINFLELDIWFCRFAYVVK
ncbi:hypothetical protein DFO77_10954 [Marinilabilia salmonicolor]|uniref:Uncharacterized protein n=1 Tax=Marinilabilia salmonicolor TaxID=989 RepID=A0A368V6Z4_9BACT|nr:hypothetical protein DFO77_10954 [Marinilabilia salmonicolor]